MTLNELQEYLLDIASAYFTGATVVWAQEKVVKPKPALVTLRTGNVSRPLQPITEVIDGVPCGYYPSRVTLEVNVFTKGRKYKPVEGKTAAQENTAVNDLVDFVNYLNSPYMIDECYILDIAITPMGAVSDASTLINDATWDYRAMAEFSVDFMQIAVGATGILAESSIKHSENPEDPEDQPYIKPEWSQTNSGGGSQELADETTGYFEEVEIEAEKEENTNEQSQRYCNGQY